MSNEEHFWLRFWAMVFTTIIICVTVPSCSNNTAIEMAKAGYVQKIVIIQQSSPTTYAVYDKIWVKVNDEPACIKLEK